MEDRPLDTPKKKILTLVAIGMAIGTLTGVAGYFHGIGGAVIGGVAGAVCGAIGAFLFRQPSR